jgi:hypothetical protein
MPTARFASATLFFSIPVVERQGAALDLDVVEREERRRITGGLEPRVDQVLDVVGAVGVAAERDARLGEAYRIEHGRASPERRRRYFDVERVEVSERLLGGTVGEA